MGPCGRCGKGPAVSLLYFRHQEQRQRVRGADQVDCVLLLCADCGEGLYKHLKRAISRETLLAPRPLVVSVQG